MGKGVWCLDLRLPKEGCYTNHLGMIYGQQKLKYEEALAQIYEATGGDRVTHLQLHNRDGTLISAQQTCSKLSDFQVGIKGRWVKYCATCNVSKVQWLEQNFLRQHRSWDVQRRLYRVCKWGGLMEWMETRGVCSHNGGIWLTCCWHIRNSTALLAPTRQVDSVTSAVGCLLQDLQQVLLDMSNKLGQ